MKKYFLMLFIVGLKTNYLQSQNTINLYVIADSSYWLKTTPITFIDTLKKYPGCIFIIEEKPQTNWYNEKYIDKLKRLLKCKTMCAGVISVNESKKRSIVKTNIGEQAEYLITSIKQKSYPYNLSSIK